MISGTYKIADIVVKINSIYQEVHTMCADYACCEEPEFVVEINQEDIDFEKIKSIKEDIYEGIPVRYFTDEYLETLSVYRKMVVMFLQKDILLFHGSLLSMDGEGYLFTAKSGTGKSTHTQLWCKAFGNRVNIVNDDKPLIKISGNSVIAYGTPWDGKHHRSVNTNVPLKAICIIERSENNHITPLTVTQAIPMLFQQSYRPKQANQLQLTMSLIKGLSENVKMYKLGCNMDIEAAYVAYEGMK